MTREQPSTGPRMPLATYLLILAALCVMWICVQSVQSVVTTGSYLTLSGTILLCFLMLILTGNLFFRRPWSLFYLSLLGKLYLILVVFLSLTKSQQLKSVSWILTSLVIIYIAVLNYINPVRFFVGLSPVSVAFVGSRFAAMVLFFATCNTLYLVYANNFLPEYAYRIQCEELDGLKMASESRVESHLIWSERWRAAIPEYLSPLEKNVGIGIWSNNQGERIIVSDNVWLDQVIVHTFRGFNESYLLEKALWKAGLSKPSLLDLKITMANEGTKAYYLENPAVRAIVVLNQSDITSPPSWVANANIYPDSSTPYNIESTSPSLERALYPILTTLEKYSSL